MEERAAEISQLEEEMEEATLSDDIGVKAEVIDLIRSALLCENVGSTASSRRASSLHSVQGASGGSEAVLAARQAARPHSTRMQLSVGLSAGQPWRQHLPVPQNTQSVSAWHRSKHCSCRCFSPGHLIHHTIEPIWRHIGHC